MRNKIIISVLVFVSLISAISFSRPAMATTDNNPNSIVVQTIPGPTLAQKITERAETSWAWYVIRGSGIIAAISLMILMLSGIGFISGSTFRFLEPITAWASHRAIGIVFGVSVLLHMIGLFFDHFISFDLLTILIPWLSDYQPVEIFGIKLGSLFVALGILAFYGSALIVITSLIWIDKKPYIWKIIHLISYIVMLFVFIHALYLGTDLSGGWMRWLWILFGVLIALSTIFRLRRAKSV